MGAPARVHLHDTASALACKRTSAANQNMTMLLAQHDHAFTLGSGTYSSASRSNSVAYASHRPTRFTAPLEASM